MTPSLTPSEGEPWRDPARYQTGRIVKCLGCGNDCHKTPWGAWCYNCNVERIERINKSMSAISFPRSPDIPREITVEQLGQAQFGRVLHKRPDTPRKGKEHG